MATAYPYLISSLPMLQLNAKAPFSFTQFIEMCRDQIPQQDLEQVLLCSTETYLEQVLSQQTFVQWQAFEIGLRNELVKIRASRKKIDAQKYLRKWAGDETGLSAIAMTSHRMVSLVEAENYLDARRWSKLEELSFGHYFDCDALIVYALKLRILLRWERVAGADKQETLERILV
jgi:hypothetical protein